MIFFRKKKKFEELVAIYNQLLEIEWNFDNLHVIQSLNFKFEKKSEEYNNSEMFSMVTMGNIIALKRINPTPENFRKVKNGTLASYSGILIEENKSQGYKFEIAVFLNPDRV